MDELARGNLPVKYGLLFLMLAACLVRAASIALHPVPRVVLFAAAGALFVVAAAYVGNWPRLLLKRADGRRHWWSWILLWPYYGLVSLTLQLYCLAKRRPAFTEVASDVWLSRRLSARELTSSGIAWVAIVDLAAEFRRIPLSAAVYLSLPTLDGNPPSVEQLQRGVKWIDNHRSRGPVLVHCALGHGRSACVIIAWLVSSGRANDVPSALAMLQGIRPGVGLKPGQRKRLDEMLANPASRPITR